MSTRVSFHIRDLQDLHGAIDIINAPDTVLEVDESIVIESVETIGDAVLRRVCRHGVFEIYLDADVETVTPHLRMDYPNVVIHDRRGDNV